MGHSVLWPLESDPFPGGQRPQCRSFHVPRQTPKWNMQARGGPKAIWSEEQRPVTEQADPRPVSQGHVPPKEALRSGSELQI